MLVLCVWLCIPEPSVGGSGVGVILMPVTKYQKFRWSRLPHSLSAQEALALPVGGGEEVSGVLPVGGIALVLHTPGLELHCTPSNWTKLRHVGHPAHSSPSAPWRVFWILRCPFWCLLPPGVPSCRRVMLWNRYNPARNLGNPFTA